MLELMLIWTVFSVVAYTYFRYLFAELGFEWNDGNRLTCAALSVTGPARFDSGLRGRWYETAGSSKTTNRLMGRWDLGAKWLSWNQYFNDGAKR